MVEQKEKIKQIYESWKGLKIEIENLQERMKEDIDSASEIMQREKKFVRKLFSTMYKGEHIDIQELLQFLVEMEEE